MIDVKINGKAMLFIEPRAFKIPEALMQFLFAK